MTVKVNDGIRLLSGNLFNYNDPSSAHVTINDIAGALSKICRFAGHLPYFYSVAQHSVNASYIVAPEFAFDALMHDTAEAFTNDIPTPLKMAVPMFKELEVSIESAMAKKFDFNYPLSSEIKKADLQMLMVEKIHIKKDASEWQILDGVQIDDILPLVDLNSWTPRFAETQFLKRYYELQDLML